MSKVQTYQKAWVIDKSIFNNPWFVPDDVFRESTENKAKSKAIKEIEYDSLTLKNGEEPSYINIKMKRFEPGDLYLVDGKVMNLEDIETKSRNDKMDDLHEANPNAFVYIVKNGMYYRPNNCGYTEHKVEAGTYRIKDAVDSVKRCGISDGRLKS